VTRTRRRKNFMIYLSQFTPYDVPEGLPFFGNVKEVLV